MEKEIIKQNADPIDLVITWVDGNDPEWIRERQKYRDPGADTRPQRYRDWGFLRFWFRGIERFAPWARTIHFVTYGHVPAWLDREHPKLHITDHREFMPKEALPTFSSRAIEANLHRIPGLSERFIYFNDDMFLIQKSDPGDFFRDGLPVDMLALQPVVANPVNPVMSYAYLNTSLAISRHFDKRSCMKRRPLQFFYPGYPFLHLGYNLLETVFPRYSGFYTVHGPSPFRKSTFSEVWEKEEELLRRTTLHRFRNSEDVSQYLFREWAKQKGEFVPANLHRMFRYLDGADCSEQNLDVIRRQKCKMICLNDSDRPFVFETNRKAFHEAFRTILPEASSFERFPETEEDGETV